MQAAWKKLNGIQPFTKADMPRLIQAYPEVYGPQFGSTAEDAEEDVKADIARMRNTLLLAPREDIAKAVARCRKCAALDGSPLPADVSEWSRFQIGIVHAALEANMETAR